MCCVLDLLSGAFIEGECPATHFSARSKGLICVFAQSIFVFPTVKAAAKVAGTQAGGASHARVSTPEWRAMAQ